MDLTKALSARSRRLLLPERAELIGESVGASERALAAAARRRGDYLDLTYADTHRFPPPEWVLPDFVEAAGGGGMTYTPFRGDRGIRERLAPAVSELLGVPVDPDRELVLTPGTQGGLFAALSALIDPGDLVLIPDPEYLASERLLRYLGADVEHVPIVWDGDEAAIDADVARELLDREPRLLLLSHPNNPTGAVYPPEALAALAALAADGDMTVVVDQLYCRLVYDGRPFTQLIAEDGMADRTVVLLGPSKTESMSGYRVGVAVAPPDVADAIEDIQSVSAIRAPAYAQHVLRRWLTEDHDYLATRIGEYQALRDELVAGLRTIDGVEVHASGGSSYVFVDVSSFGSSDQQLAERLVLDQGLLVNPGYQFGPRGVGSFRVCFAQPEAEIPRIVAGIERTLGRLQSDR